MRDDFKRPPAGYGLVPLWLWNGRLEGAELRRQVHAMKAQGLSGFFMRAHQGLQTPYLSEEWFAAVRTAVEAAAEVGLEVHLYHEEGGAGASGAAGRQVTRQHPAFRGQYLQWQEWDLPAYLQAGEIGPGVQLDVKQRGQIGAIVAVPYTPAHRAGVGPLDLEGAVLITPFTTAETRGRLQGTAWRVFAFMVQTWDSIDVFNPVAVRQLIQLTHERYAAEVGLYFGRTILSLFHKGAELMPEEDRADSPMLPWSPRLPQEFRRRRGADLWPLLPALVADCGPRTARVRQDFQETVAELLVESFYQPLAKWCACHRLALTGQAMAGESLGRRTCQQAIVSSACRYLQIPGVDHRGRRFQGWDPKLASSVAHQQHRERVLSVCWGSDGWGRTLAERKQALDWQLAQGINLFVPHAFHYTVAGHRKRESPPSDFEQEPSWKHYSLLSQYAARLCYALTRGQPGVRVAVLYPLRSSGIHDRPALAPEWTPGRSGSENGERSRWEMVERDLFWVCQELVRLHYEFDFLTEELLAKAIIANGLLDLGQADYELLVLPSVTALHTRTVERIEQFIRRGGRVLAAGLLPTLSETGPDRELERRVAGWFGKEPRPSLAEWGSFWDFASEGELRLWGGEGRGLSGRTLYLQTPTSLSHCQPREAFAEALSQLLPPDLMVHSEGTEAEQVVFHHRVDRDRHFYWLVYTGTVPFTAELELPVEGLPELWDATTGEVQPVTIYSVGEGRTSLALPFRGQEGQLLVISSGQEIHAEAANFEVQSIHWEDGDGGGNGSASPPFLVIRGLCRHEDTLLATITDGVEVVEVAGKAVALPRPKDLADTWTLRRLDDNTLVLADWRIGRYDGPPDVAQAAALATEPLPVRQGGPCWLQGEFRAADLPPFALFRTTFGVDVSLLEPTARTFLRLVVEPIDVPWSLYVNGTLVEPTRQGDLDGQFLSADVADWIREGENEVVLVADYRPVRQVRPDQQQRTWGDLVPEPARLRGNFQVMEREKQRSLGRDEPRLLPAGTWTQQGYPHYSGTMEYRQEFHLTESEAKACWTLRLEQVWNVAEVVLNGAEVGQRAWSPWEFDLTAQIRPGTNHLAVRVTNTALNALLGESRPSGLSGRARLEPADHCELRAPAGRFLKPPWKERVSS